MDSNNGKLGCQEKPTYDTGQCFKANTPTESSTSARLETSTMSQNKQGDYAASQLSQQEDEGKAMWTQVQEDYAYDYIRRLKERYADKPERITATIELLRRRQVLERRDVWLEVCRIMHDAPDLRDGFKNFMGAEDGSF